MGDRNGAHGARVRHRGRAARAHAHGRGLGRRRLAARHRDVDALVRRAGRAAGRAAARDVDERGRVRRTRSSASTARRTTATSSSCSSRPTATGADFCRLDRPRRAGRRPALRRPRGPRASTPRSASPCSTRSSPSRTFAEWKALLSGIDAPWAPVQAVEELLDDPQVVANDYIGEVAADGGPSYRLPDGAGAVRRRRTRSCAVPPSTASTPSWSCSSSATRGTTSPRCRRRERIP